MAILFARKSSINKEYLQRGKFVSLLRTSYRFQKKISLKLSYQFQGLPPYKFFLLSQHIMILSYIRWAKVVTEIVEKEIEQNDRDSRLYKVYCIQFIILPLEGRYSHFDHCYLG